MQREAVEECYIDNDYAWFKIVNDEDSLLDCSEFEDASIYVPIYRKMIKNGDMVVFGYRKEDNKCFMRACVQLHGNVTTDGCYVRTLQSNEGYIHYVFCNVADRRHGAHNSIISFICTQLKGYTLYAIVKEDNVPSLRGFYKNNFNVKAKLSQYNICGLRKMVQVRPDVK